MRHGIVEMTPTRPCSASPFVFSAYQARGQLWLLKTIQFPARPGSGWLFGSAKTHIRINECRLAIISTLIITLILLGFLGPMSNSYIAPFLWCLLFPKTTTVSVPWSNKKKVRPARHMENRGRMPDPHLLVL